MKITALTVFLSTLFSGTLTGAATDKMDVQTDYLHHLMTAAKLRPTVHGELNFSPHEGEFANIARSVAGKMGWC